ncbi:hypothetical protein DPMN_133427 [Dreissena polymorpha]|uniref:Uncharacterized protein n=1 Tax=Dreissena polymorpha TaxID=45954 RepID=A0A9D4JAZ3_DREPO|nr:hypothetical protein DPMN_133427 [Dreissena polymorpha]
MNKSPQQFQVNTSPVKVRRLFRSTWLRTLTSPRRSTWAFTPQSSGRKSSQVSREALWWTGLATPSVLLPPPD